MHVLPQINSQSHHVTSRKSCTLALIIEVHDNQDVLDYSDERDGPEDDGNSAQYI